MAGQHSLLPGPFTQLDALASCQIDGAVVLSAATNSQYWWAADASARRAQPALPCIVVATSTDVEASDITQSAYARALWLPEASWRPDQFWCDEGRARDGRFTPASGWRHTHILKTAGLVRVLESGYDCLLVDSDWQLVAPSQLLAQFRTLAVDLVAAPEVCAYATTGGVPQTLHACRRLNIGLAWVRRSAHTLHLARRVANRTHAAWDQLILNEEFGHSPNSTCCFVSPDRLRRYASFDKDLSDSVTVSGTPTACSASASGVRTLAPPPDSDEYLQWDVHAIYNDIDTNRSTSTKCTSTACFPEDDVGTL